MKSPAAPVDGGANKADSTGSAAAAAAADKKPPSTEPAGGDTKAPTKKADEKSGNIVVLK